MIMSEQFPMREGWEVRLHIEAVAQRRALCAVGRRGHGRNASEDHDPCDGSERGLLYSPTDCFFQQSVAPKKDILYKLIKQMPIR